MSDRVLVGDLLSDFNLKAVELELDDPLAFGSDLVEIVEPPNLV